MSSPMKSPGTSGAGSAPASLLASATGYQVFACCAPGKLEKIRIVPAEPSTADVAVQVSGSTDAASLISARLSSVAPQTSAANWKAIRRCCPTVVPGLPPIGAAGVGSLKPTPSALKLTIVIVALADARGAVP